VKPKNLLAKNIVGERMKVWWSFIIMIPLDRTGSSTLLPPFFLAPLAFCRFQHLHFTRVIFKIIYD
jgi:hypothetical protein